MIKKKTWTCCLVDFLHFFIAYKLHEKTKTNNESILLRTFVSGA